MLLLLLLIASWLLRAVVPVAPAVTLTAIDTHALSSVVGPSDPVADPMPALRTTLDDAWMLGRDVPMTHSFADGRRERVTIKAGRICFDDQGGGLHEQVTIGPTAKWDCKAPMTAKFWSNGTLVASQPDVICEGEPLVRWAATRLTCQRVNDELALCQAVDKSGRTQVEFRREP